MQNRDKTMQNLAETMQNRADVYGITQQDVPYRIEASNYKKFLIKHIESQKLSIETLRSLQALMEKPTNYFKQFTESFRNEAAKHIVSEIMALKCPQEMPYYFNLCSPAQIKYWGETELKLNQGTIHLDLTRLATYTLLSLTLPQDVWEALRAILMQAETIVLLAGNYSYRYRLPDLVLPRNKHIVFAKREVAADKRNKEAAHTVKTTLLPTTLELIRRLDPASLDLTNVNAELLDLCEIQKKIADVKWPTEYCINEHEFNILSDLLKDYTMPVLDLQNSKADNIVAFLEALIEFLHKTKLTIDVLRLPPQIRNLSKAEWELFKQKIIDLKQQFYIEVKMSKVKPGIDFESQLCVLNNIISAKHSLKRTVLTFFRQQSEELMTGLANALPAELAEEMQLQKKM